MWSLLLACAPDPAPEPPAAPPERVSTVGFLEWPEDPELELPIVISIHGIQGRARRMIDLVRDCGVEARVIAPIAPDARSWFRIDRANLERPVDPIEAGAAADEIERLLVDVSRMRRYPGKLVVTGFSQGGVLSWVLAARRPDLVGAALPMSGGLPPDLEPHPLPAELPVIRQYQPEFDEFATPDRIRKFGLDQWLAAGGDAKLVVIEGTHHEMREPMREKLCEGLREVLPR